MLACSRAKAIEARPLVVNRASLMLKIDGISVLTGSLFVTKSSKAEAGMLGARKFGVLILCGGFSTKSVRVREKRKTVCPCMLGNV